MAFEEIIAGFDTVQLGALLAAFIIFIYIVKQAVQTVINITMVAAISSLFPFAANYAGISVPTDINGILFFTAAGVGLYLLYVLGRIIYGALRIAGKVGRIFVPSSK
ncbi:MAG: hypothetical protein HY365_02970 [Candidatus Aenigmarchaeota archaeon]|nr:hypothetical protein [Candidatus Aenigmarchaeota archaeon]